MRSPGRPGHTGARSRPWPLVGLPRRGLRPRADRRWPCTSAKVVIGQVHLHLGGLHREHPAGQPALQRQRVAPVGQLAQPLPPGPPQRDGRDVSPASAPAFCAGEVLGLLQRQRAEGERHLGAHQDAQVVGRRAPAPAAEAPVPALSRPRAPIRSVKACTNIAPAYRHATVPVLICAATRQPARSPGSCPPSVIRGVGRCAPRRPSRRPRRLRCWRLPCLCRQAGPWGRAARRAARAARRSGSGYAPELAADLGVGEALSSPGAGLPQPGRARAAAGRPNLVDQSPGAVLHGSGSNSATPGRGWMSNAGSDWSLPGALRASVSAQTRSGPASPYRRWRGTPTAGSGLACTVTAWPLPVWVTRSGENGVHAGELLGVHAGKRILLDHNKRLF